MSVELDPRAADDVLSEEYEQYKALSVLAVTSGALGLLSSLAFLNWGLALIPVLGVLTGLVALRRIRLRPTELTGSRVAWAGILLSILFLCGGWAYLAYAYVTELPAGYERLSYASLQPDTEVKGEIYPPDVADWNGKRVFIKGYVYPGKQQSGIKQFVLCRDNGDCCFGGQPKLTDRILVTLKGPLALEYSTRLRHVGGTFRFEPANAVDGLGGVIYHLDADYLK
ncbi:MAG: DUF4190 domain-containing protein [Planctomycetia bacterium]|nr:DUF4190 domain-containing protein [Planctomycetia bacterium]